MKPSTPTNTIGGQGQDDEVEVEDVLARRRSSAAAAACSRHSEAEEHEGQADAEDRPQPGSGRRSLHQLVSRLLVRPTRGCVVRHARSGGLRRHGRIVAKGADAARPASAPVARGRGSAPNQAGQAASSWGRSGRASTAKRSSPSGSRCVFWFGVQLREPGRGGLALDHAAARAVAEDRPAPRRTRPGRHRSATSRTCSGQVAAVDRLAGRRRARRGGTPRARRAASPRSPRRRPADQRVERHEARR